MLSGVLRSTPSGLSHLPAHDRTPAVPIRNEPFRVRFQAPAGDLTSVRTRRLALGVPPRFFAAGVVGQRGPYDIWEAQVDGQDAARVFYEIEVTDGADVDFIGVDGRGETAAPGGRFLLDFDTFSPAPPGATPATGGAAYRVLAPFAPSAFARGEFNGWGLGNPTTKVGDEFIAFAPGAAAGDAYKFFFDATATWKPDAFAKQLDPPEFLNSVVVEPEDYTWVSGPFTPPAFGSMVCYQLHVGTFSGRNDPAATTPPGRRRPRPGSRTSPPAQTTLPSWA